MTPGCTTPAIDSPIVSSAAQIRAEIPQAEVRLFGSRVHGEHRPDSDADLLITVPDAWLQRHNRPQVLGRLSRNLSSRHLPLDRCL